MYKMYFRSLKSVVRVTTPNNSIVFDNKRFRYSSRIKNCESGCRQSQKPYRNWTSDNYQSSLLESGGKVEPPCD